MAVPRPRPSPRSDARNDRPRLSQGAVFVLAVTLSGLAGAYHGAGAGVRRALVWSTGRDGVGVDAATSHRLWRGRHPPSPAALPAPDPCAIPAHANANASCTRLVTSGFPYLGHDVFMDACDHVFVPGQALHLTSPSLVFLHPRDIAAFGTKAVHSLRHDIVLVSNSNVDECLPYRSSKEEATLRPAYTAILAHPRVRAWYGPNVVLHHPKLKPLPLGGKWNWRSTLHHAEDENKGPILSVLSTLARDPGANFRAADRPNLLFTRMDPSTSDGATYAPTRRHRRAALDAAGKFPQAKPLNNNNTNHPTCSSSSTALPHIDRLETYLRDMRTYKFVLSPPGNGLDTHRTWEALLMGAVPVVESSAMDPVFEGLPVLILDSWQDLTQELLGRKYAELRQRGASSYCWGRLYAPFYVQRMLGDLGGGGAE